MLIIDLWANITLVMAASYYLNYSLTVFQNKEKYDTCLIYEKGDVMYFVNACFYIICSARDCGVFWFMPHYGRFPNMKQDAANHYSRQQQQHHLEGYDSPDYETRHSQRGLHSVSPTKAYSW